MNTHTALTATRLLAGDCCFVIVAVIVAAVINILHQIATTVVCGSIIVVVGHEISFATSSAA